MSNPFSYTADEPLTTFIGRQHEQAALLELLDREDVRLITITGPGGVGKTRLALKVSSTAAAAGGYRRWVVPLESVHDDGLVSLAIARVLGVQEQQDLAPAIAAFLDGQPGLILVDNFEQVVDAAPFLAAILRESSGLKVLVTSRSPLRVSGEHVFETPPMTLVRPGARMDGSVLEQSEAARLFIARALAVNPRFPTGPESYPAIVELCSRLDGLPLAIELAAARANVLTPLAMVTRMDNSLRLLTHGARDQPERLQSLRGAIAWSYDLLLPQDQAVFRRLSVFTESFSLKAVDHVIPDLNLLDTMATLVDSSLVRLVASIDDDIRYRMFETIREFGSELLVEAGEFEAARCAHAYYFAGLAREAVIHLHKVADEVLVNRLEQDLGNFRAALATLTDIGDWDRLLQMAGDIAWFMFYRGLVIEGKRWVESALQLADQNVAPGSRAWALIGSGLMTQIAGDAELAERRFAEAAGLAAEAGEEWYRFVATSLRAGALVTLGRFDEAAILFESNLRHSGFGPHPAWQAHTKFHLGIIAFSRDQLDEAAALFVESIELCDQIESYLDAIDALQYLALVQIRQHRFAQAATTIDDMLERLVRRQSDSDMAIGIAVVAIFADRVKAPQAAVQLFAAANELRRRTSLPFPEPALTVFLEERPKIEAQLPPVEVEALRQAGQSFSSTEAVDVAREIVEMGAQGIRREADATSGNAKFSLTEREIDVLRLIADGLTNEQIASALFISSGTVRTHIANIFGKLNARTRTEAARIALRNDLI